MTTWVDEHPDRYGPIRDGDYGPLLFRGNVHFVRFSVGFQLGAAGFGIYPDKVACGAELPDWQANPESYPITGVVDCPECLREIGEYRA